MRAEEWRARRRTLAEAIEALKPFRRIVFPNQPGHPATLLDGIVANLEGIGPKVLIGADMTSRFSFLPAERVAAVAGMLRLEIIGGKVPPHLPHHLFDYHPCSLGEVDHLIRSGHLPVDACVIQCSPPDADGWCSLGLFVGHSKSAVSKAKFTVAEINPRVPRVRGDAGVHISQIGAYVETDRPLYELPVPVPDEVDRNIARRVADLVEDGATVQLGIGSVPEGVLAAFQGKAEVLISSGAIPEGVIGLVEKGIIRKPIIGTCLLGSNRLFAFADNNPMLELHPVQYTHGERLLQYPNFTAINSAIEVDLTGQINTETVRGRWRAYAGGQIDFMRFAGLVPRGRSILALRSTTGDSKASRIVPGIASVDTVSTSRNDVHFVVTEYGVAEMRGKPLKARLEAMVAIAHPDFRSALADAAKEIAARW